MAINDDRAVEARRRHPPYGLLGALAIASLLTAAAASLVYLGHPAPPAAAVIVAVAPAAVQAPAATAGASAQPAAASAPPNGAVPAGKPAPPAVPAPATHGIAPLTPAPTPLASTPAALTPSPLARALAPAPDPALIARGTYGFVPVIDKADRHPWKVYARPFDLSDKRPRIAIIMTGLGISASATDAAIREAPGPVTLAFAPFARRLGQWMNLARANGHETLIELPMEPIDYPRQDPGFNALLTALAPPQNIDRLGWVMAQGAGYVGLMGRLGGRFSAASDAMKPVLQEISKHGLLYVDNRSTPQSVVPHIAPSIDLPFAGVTRFIDTDPSPVEIDRSLADLEETAKRTGAAVGAAAASKSTLARVAAWEGGLEARGIVLAPVSAVVALSGGGDKGSAP